MIKKKYYTEKYKILREIAWKDNVTITTVEFYLCITIDVKEEIMS